jgi:hypothetical protein
MKNKICLIVFAPIVLSLIGSCGSDGLISEDDNVSNDTSRDEKPIEAVSPLFEYNSETNSYEVTGCDWDKASATYDDRISVDIPEKYEDETHGILPVTAVQKDAFKLWRYLVAVTFPSTLKTIGDDAFTGCEIENLSIPASVTSIGFYAFTLCDNLKTIFVDSENQNYSTDGRSLFDKNQTFIYTYAAQSGTSYQIPDKVTAIDYSAFYDTSLTKISIPSSVSNMEGSICNCPSMSSFVVDGGNETYETDGRAIYNKKTKAIINYAQASGAEYSIKEGAVTLSRDTFWNNTKIEKITLPSTLQTIEKGSFYSCKSLKSISLPANVSYLGSDTFEDCDSLSSLIVDDDNQTFSTDGHALFNKNKTSVIVFIITTTTKTYDIPATVETLEQDSFSSSKLKSINLPNGLKKINAFAFSLCYYLSSIKIPSSVTYLDDYVFDYDDSLSNVEYESTVADFKALLNASNSEMSKIFQGTKVTGVKCTDGTVNV